MWGRAAPALRRTSLKQGARYHFIDCAGDVLGHDALADVKRPDTTESMACGKPRDATVLPLKLTPIASIDNQDGTPTWIAP
jgi:hypothetical protein